MRDHVDRVEVNERIAADALTVEFRQLIFWRWVKRESRFEVQHWAQFNKHARVWAIGGGWLVQFRTRAGQRYEVFTRQLIRTRTQHDPEVDDRALTPQRLRRGLWGLPHKN